MKHLATTLQAVGTSIMAVSLAMIYLPLGIAFAGAGLLAFGIAAERN